MDNAPREKIPLIPNLLTGLRVVMIVPILALAAAGPEKRIAAAAVFLAAIATDMLDGFAARKLNQRSDFGAMFDLAADRVIMTPSLLFLGFTGALSGARGLFPLAPDSYVWFIVFSDFTTLAGLYMFTRARRKNPALELPGPPVVAKAAYPVQASVVFCALAGFSGPIIATAMYAAAILTVAAFVVYMKKGGFVFKEGLK